MQIVCRKRDLILEIREIKKAKKKYNMKYFMSILAVIGISLSVMAQTRTENGKTTVDGIIELDKTVHDFGDIQLSAGPQKCSFTVKNISAKPIAINTVVSSCGCTDVKWTREPIAAGKNGVIEATFNNEQGAYPFDKTLTVYISGLKKPLILRLRGNVLDKAVPLGELYPKKWGNLGIRDTEIKLGNMEQGNQRSDAVYIANLGATPLTVSFENVTPGLKIEVSPNPIPANTAAKMTYTVTADRSQWGKSWFYAEPVIGGKHYKGAKVGIWAFIKEDFSSMSQAERNKAAQPMFEQSTYSFGKVKAGTDFEAVFKFTNAGKSELVVHKVDSDSPAAVPGRISATAAGAKGTLKVPVHTKDLPKGETLIIITLTTNSPLRPLVNLFIAGVIE